MGKSLRYSDLDNMKLENQENRGNRTDMGKKKGETDNQESQGPGQMEGVRRATSGRETENRDANEESLALWSEVGRAIISDPP